MGFEIVLQLKGYRYTFVVVSLSHSYEYEAKEDLHYDLPRIMVKSFFSTIVFNFFPS